MSDTTSKKLFSSPTTFSISSSSTTAQTSSINTSCQNKILQSPPLLQICTTDQQMKQLQPPSSPLIVPDVQQLKKMLMEKFTSCEEDVNVFCNKSSVKEIIKLIVHHYEYTKVFPINTSRTLFLFPCPNQKISPYNDTCQLYSLHRYEYSKPMVCKTCNNIIDRDRRKKAKRVEVECMTRMRPINTLSPESLKKQYLSQRKNIKASKLAVQRMKEKLENYKSSLVIESSSPANEILIKAMKFITHKESKSKEEILKSFFEMELSSEECEGVTDEEKKECASILYDSLNNMSLKLQKKDKCCRYSPYVINVTMSLFLRNKKAYDDIRSSGLLCLPSPRKLNEISSNLKVYPGGDANVYIPFQQEIEENEKEVVGHLMMDEIKLKNGIAFNCKSNEITGFVTEQLNTKSILKEMVADDSIGKAGFKNKPLSVYCNQWRFRST